MFRRYSLACSFLFFLISPQYASAQFKMQVDETDLELGSVEPDNILDKLKSKPLLKDHYYFYLGRDLFEKNKIKTALKVLNKIDEQTCSKPIELFKMKAHIHYFLKNKKDAAHYYKEYLSLINDKTPLEYDTRKEMYFFPKLRLALLLEKTEPEKSLELFQDLYANFPEESPQYILRKLKWEIPENLLYQRAETFFKLMRHNEAENLYMKYLKKSKKEAPHVYATLKRLTAIYKLTKNAKMRRHVTKLLKNLEIKKAESDKNKNLFNLAKLYWNQERIRLALKTIKQILKESPKAYKDEALLMQAKILAGQKKYKNAMQALKNIQNPYKKEIAEETLYLLGWYSYYSKAFDAAEEHWKTLIIEYPQSSYVLASKYWQAQAMREQNKNKELSAVLNEIETQDPYSYYTYLSHFETRRPRFKKVPKAIGFDFPKKTLDYYKINTLWLRKAKALIDIHLFSDAEHAVNQAFKKTKIKKLPWELQFFRSTLFALSTNYLHAIIILNSLMRKKAKLPDFFIKFQYPRPYWNIVKEIAEQHDLNPYFFLAMMRQESAFNKNARSPANALGLLQILPSTGRALASKDKNKFNPLDLFEPRINIELSARLLSRLLSKFDGNLILTLAAYNAGEPAIAKWKRSIRRVNTREFIERIPFSETRNYVKLVLRNYHNYLRIYEHKSLPPVYMLYTNYQTPAISLK